MILKYFYDKKLAQASYLVGCAKTGEALVIDPSRDVSPYLQAAHDENLHITHITETHIHADYVSGSRELATRTGGRLLLSDMGDENWKYSFADDNTVLLRDSDWWMVGNIRVDVIHTPGHTPEHVAFMITDTAGADRPMGIFTGDFLFVGDVGRPDLLEEAAGFTGTKEVGARQQFHTVQRIKELPDYLQIWPGHGAGSACGKALGAVPSTTLGYEKLFNPAFQINDEDRFVEWLLDGQPEAPHYFAQMKRVNKEGPTLLAELARPQRLDHPALENALKKGHLVVDMRDPDAFSREFVPNTINIPATDGGCVNNLGWFVDYSQPLYIIAQSDDEAHRIIGNIRAIGVDNIGGYFTPEVVTGETYTLQTFDSSQLAERLTHNGIMILDVRGINEYREKHIKGAYHMPLGFIPERYNKLPKDRQIVAHCASGFRSQIAVSLLRRYGFDNVINLNEGIEVWSRILELETVQN